MKENPIRPCRDDSYLRDESRQIGSAESISFPRDEHELREILRLSAAAGRRVTVQGSRTGVSAGAVPCGGHILNLSRMSGVNGMAYADDGGFLLRVQPGLTLDALKKQLESRRFDNSRFDAASCAAARDFAQAPPHFFAPDPTETTASLGGMAACNASGAKSYRYGPMRRYVEALRVALIDGDMLILSRGERRARGRRLSLVTEAGRPLELELPRYQMPRVKNASGYFIEDDMDAVDLFIGSDGSLGVISELTLRLLPLPPLIWGATFLFAAEQQAADMVMALRDDTTNSGNTTSGEACIAAIEYFDSGALSILRRSSDGAFAQLPRVEQRFSAALYLELHAESEAAALLLLKRLSRAARAAGGSDEDSWLARNAAQRERLRLFRHAVPEAVNMLIDGRRRQYPQIGKLSTDMSVPDARLSQVMALYRGSLKREGLQAAIWGHIGDNHLHVNILPREPAEYERGQRLYRQWAEIISGWGGAVSAEHGVGKLKAPYLMLMYGEENIRAMAALKAALDPLCLLGAETMIPSEQVLKAAAARG